MENLGFVPGDGDEMVTENSRRVESALLDTMEQSTESSSEVPPDIPRAEPPRMTANQSIGTQTSSSEDPNAIGQAVRSLEQLVGSEFGELRRALNQHCRRHHRLLQQIRVRIDELIRQQRPSDQRNTRSSLAIRRSQHHLQRMAQRASAPRTQRSAVQRSGPRRSASLGISAGPRSRVIRRRSARSLTHQARDNPGFSRNGRAGTSRATLFNLRNASFS